MSGDREQEIELLVRFLNQMHARGEVDTDARLAGMQAVRLRITDLLNNGPGRKKGRRITIDHPAFGVAMDYARGAIDYKTAVARVAALIHKGERSAEAALADMVPRARRTLESRELLDSLPQKMDP